MPPKGSSNVSQGSIKTQPSNGKRKALNNQNGPPPKRYQRNPIQAAREIHSQRTSSLPKDAATDSINLATFLSTREYEIKALEDGMARSKKVLSKRAFQQVPHDLRRRTASHNAKRVPERLRERAAREMKDDNTPIVKQGVKKGSARSRIRAETAKRLGILAGKKKATKSRNKGEPVDAALSGRIPMPKLKRGALSLPPKPKSKFRKRQIHKTWLPTHLWHTKRSTMTEPKTPLWRFAIPLTPTEKSYRPTHRAGGARGAVCWDMSYMSTIGLQGSDNALEKVLRCVGVTDDKAWGKAGSKWRAGKRGWNGWTSRECKSGRRMIGPATIIWQAPKTRPELVELLSEQDAAKPKKEKVETRQIILRIHPAAFLELWTEILRISKQQRPIVHVEDLRFEIGSIDITGPGAMETLLGILHPIDGENEHGKLFRNLAGTTNASSLPLNALLSFSIIDPRLRYPPRMCPLPDSSDAGTSLALLRNLAEWPSDTSQPSLLFWDKKTRHKATLLPSQKAINRRKGLEKPGDYPKLTELDPGIPIIILASRSNGPRNAQGTFTILAPWKCILPIWYGIVHYPLSSGGNPRHGGLQELQQLAFEHDAPWYPCDFPGTDAGWSWELEQQALRKKEWEKRPKGKRTAFESLDLSCGRKGEVGLPWGCDFDALLQDPVAVDSQAGKGPTLPAPVVEDTATPHQKAFVRHLSKESASALLTSPSQDVPPTAIATIHIILLSRGVPQPAARVYRLPSNSPTPADSLPLNESTTSTASANSASQKISTLPSNLRQQWLSLVPPSTTKKPTKSKDFTPNGLKAVPVSRNKDMTLEERKVALAQELLKQPALPYPKEKNDNQYPVVPGQDDLIGFVTTGNFNLAKGQGTAIGSVLLSRVLGSEGSEREKRLCVVRNVGESMGRLARWELV